MTSDGWGLYTKSKLMRMKKEELEAIADAEGVDVDMLEKVTKDTLSDAILASLEPPPMPLPPDMTNVPHPPVPPGMMVGAATIPLKSVRVQRIEEQNKPE